MPQAQPSGRTFAKDTAVDFVVIGSGPAGGSVARELSRRGFDVVLLEQGRVFGPEEMDHDELGAFFNGRWTNDAQKQPQTYRKTASAKAKKRNYVGYART